MYATKEIAMTHVSSNPVVAAKQIRMIDAMYGVNMQVSQNDLDSIALDVSRDDINKAMSY